MTELPIFTVIGRTIAFVAGNLWTLFRLTWLPLALLIATQIGQIFLMLWSVGEVVFASVDGVYAFFWFIWSSIVLQTIAFTTIAVQVHRVVLFDERSPGHYFNFPFGWTEGRYVIMGILSSLFLFLPISVAAYAYYAYKMKVVDAAIVALMAAPSVPLTQGQGWINLAIIVIVVVSMIWLLLRLSLWPAAVVANNRLALGDAWRTTRGNALPLLAMFVLAYIFLIIVVVALQIAFLSYAPQDFAFAGDVSDTPRMKDIITDGPGWFWGPNAILLEFINQFLISTFTVAILSFAYTALKNGENKDATLHMPMTAT